MNEIELGNFFDETRNGLLSIVERLLDEDKIEAVIFGYTERPLILTKDEFGIVFLNTSQIHVDSIIRCYIDETVEK